MSNLKDFIGGGSIVWWDEKYENKLEITTSQDWTVPDNVSEVTVGICGGGGAGADNYNNTGGGGGSKMTYHTLEVTPGETITISIGAGGVFGSGDGGATSFGVYVSADGGKGGATSESYGGEGGNGAPSGGMFDAGDFGTMPQPLIVEKVIGGAVFAKQIFSPAHKYGAGGCGGGWDYPGVGGCKDNPPTGYGSGSGGYSGDDGRPGICVIWY